MMMMIMTIMMVEIKEDLDGDVHLNDGGFVERVGDTELEGILARLDENVLALDVTQLLLEERVQ